jgi:MFS family permease
VSHSWRNRDVRLIVVAFALPTTGEWVLGTSVAIHAFGAGGALAVGFVGFRFAPAALAGLFTAQLGERLGRRRVLTGTPLARAVTTAAAAGAVAVDAPIAAVIALVWIDAMEGSAYRPAQAALLPSVSRSPGQLTAATALASNAKTAGQIAGALAGGC